MSLPSDDERIKALLKAMQDISGGDYGGQLPISDKHDTLDAIAFSYNILSAEVGFRTAQLEAALKDLRETQDRLVVSTRLAAIGEMCTALAHQINNPLAVIMGISHRLEIQMSKAPDTIDAAEVAEQLRTVTKHVDRIAKVLLHIQGHMRLEPLRTLDSQKTP